MANSLSDLRKPGSEITLLINIRREENYKEFSRIIQTWTRSDNKCLMCERVNV